MKILRYVMFAVLALGASGVAHAFATTVLDPPTGDGPFFVMHPGVEFSFQYANCSVFVDNVKYTGCALGFNDSNQTITTFDLGFANAPVLDSAPASCFSNAFSDFSCGLTPDGSEYDLSFEDGCGSDTCGILPFHFVVLLENGAPGGEFPEVDSVWLESERIVVRNACPPALRNFFIRCGRYLGTSTHIWGRSSHFVISLVKIH